jgi:hypothetical protein
MSEGSRMLVLSAQALQIKPAEHKAILEIRELFAKDVFVHDPDLELAKPDGFNMNIPMDSSECGTTCCIGGWMFKAMERDRTAPCVHIGDYVNNVRSSALGPLFLPFTNVNGATFDGDYDFPLELMTPKMALAAIDNFLATGDPNWPLVCGFTPEWVTWQNEARAMP